MLKKIILLLLALLLTCLPAFAEVLVDGDIAVTDELIVEYGYDYYTPDEVALYLYATAAGTTRKATCGTWPTACASAAINSATAKACCRKNEAASITNATSTLTAVTAAESASYSPTTA